MLNGPLKNKLRLKQNAHKLLAHGNDILNNTYVQLFRMYYVQYITKQYASIAAVHFCVLEIHNERAVYVRYVHACVKYIHNSFSHTQK